MNAFYLGHDKTVCRFSDALEENKTRSMSCVGDFCYEQEIPDRSCMRHLYYGQDISDLAFSTSAPPPTPPIAGKSLRVLHAKPPVMGKNIADLACDTSVMGKNIADLACVTSIMGKILPVLNASPLL